MSPRSASVATLAAVLVCALPSTRAAQGGQAPVSGNAQAFTADLRARSSVPGLAIAAGVNGRIVASHTAGFADLSGKIPVSRTSAFRIGSLSKLLTASAALRLHQAGRLDLDAPLRDLLSGVPGDKGAITPRQLLGHLSGLAHYGSADYVNTQTYANVSDTTPRLLATALVAPPGTRYAYSSYGFNVLGAVLQAVSGREFRRLVAEEVSRPLGLTNTVAESPEARGDRAQLYSLGSDKALSAAAPSDLTDRWPSGGYLSTAEDLVRFGMGVLQPDYLRAPLREAAFTPQRLADGTETRVGLAWRIARDEAGRRYVHHGGDSVGGRAFILVYPDHGVAVAIVANLSLAGITEKDALSLAQTFLPGMTR